MITPITNCQPHYNRKISFTGKAHPNNTAKNLALSAAIGTAVGLGGIAEAEEYEPFEYRQYLMETRIKPQDDIFRRSTLLERIDKLKLEYNIWVLHQNLENIEGYTDTNTAERIITITSKDKISISFNLDANSDPKNPVIIRMQGSKNGTMPNCIFQGLRQGRISGSRHSDTLRLIDCSNIIFNANGGNDEISAKNLHNSELCYVRKVELMNSNGNTVFGEKYGLTMYMENCNDNVIAGQRSLNNIYLYNGTNNCIVCKGGHNQVGIGGVSKNNTISTGNKSDKIHLADNHRPNITFKFPLTSGVQQLDGHASDNIISTGRGEDLILQGIGSINNQIITKASR